MKYIKVLIHETGRGTLKENPSLFNIVTEEFDTLEDAKTFIIERYGKIPRGKIYTDDKEDGNAKQVGYIYSFWNQDISHNSKKWFQTDWIELRSVFEEPMLF